MGRLGDTKADCEAFTTLGQKRLTPEPLYHSLASISEIAYLANNCIHQAPHRIV